MFVKLTTVVGLGEIFMIICLLLFSVIEIDSRTNINQISPLYEGRNMGSYIVTKGVVMSDKKTKTKRFLKGTPRKKRDFVKVVDKCCNLLLNTTTSTCTPFFIRRTKMNHRKTTRLKIPIIINTMPADTLPANERLQNQEKSKIKKLLFHKHSSTFSPVFTDTGELITSENLKRIKRTTFQITPEVSLPSENVIFNESCPDFGLELSNNSITLNHITLDTVSPPTKINTTTAELGMNLPLCGLDDSNQTSSPPENESINDSKNTTSSTNQFNESTLTDMSNKTNMTTTPKSKIKSILEKIKLMKLFQPTKTPDAYVSTKLQNITNLQSTKVLVNCTTLAATQPSSSKSTKNVLRGQETRNNVSITCLPKTTKQFKKLEFRVRHNHKDFSTELFTQCDVTKPVYTSHKNVSSSRYQLNKTPKHRKVKSSRRNNWKHLALRNMLYRRKTTGTLESTVNQTVLNRETTLKTSTTVSKFVSNLSSTTQIFSSVPQNESKTVTECNHLKENLMTRLFHRKKQKQEEEMVTSQSVFENSILNGNDVLDQLLPNTTVGRPNWTNNHSDYTSNNDGQENNDKTSHSPFKIKYMIRFKSPTLKTSNTQSDLIRLSLNSLTTKEITSDKKERNEEYVPSGAFSTEATEAKDICDSSSDGLKVSSQLDNKQNLKLKLKKNQWLPTKKCSHNALSKKDQTDENLLENSQNTQQLKQTTGYLRLKEMFGMKEHKAKGKNKNCKCNSGNSGNVIVVTKPGMRGTRKQLSSLNTSADINKKERLTVTVHNQESTRFRDWFFRRTTSPTTSKNKNEQHTFRWCLPTINTNTAVGIGRPNPWRTCPLYGASEEPTMNSETSIFPSGKRFKNLFHFKTSYISTSEPNTTPIPVPVHEIKEVTKLYKPNGTTKKFNQNYQTPRNNTHQNTSRNRFKPEPVKSTSNNNNTGNKNQLKIKHFKSKSNFTTTTGPSMTIKVYGRGKVKELFHMFHTKKMYPSNETSSFQMNVKNHTKKENGTVILNPDYADYIETKVESKKRKKPPNQTKQNKPVIHNASDVNDTSFNVMAYVMKPFDSLVSVFKALSPNSVTKIGDVNATDIKNGSLPHHLQPPNSSIVILAVNSTNATSKDVHESKLGMALDLLGGMYHCVFNNFVEARTEDIHFYLYTRNSPEDPEELFLPPETPGEKVTLKAHHHHPHPVMDEDKKQESTSDIPPYKREVEDDEDYDDDFDFEALNPAKTEIQSKLFNVRAETKVLIHGYLQDSQTDIMVSLREAYLARGPYNVVVVDWSVLVGDNSCYPIVASRGLRQVGNLLAQLLNHLVEAGVSPNRIHIIGFSLGAHVAGHAGTFLSFGLVSRITGLDPALPYVPMEPDVSLDSDDASFVDIIHSAAGLLGQSGPMGHVDFYPNGGSQQPGCELSSLSCSHRRAALYFIESINSEYGFQATKCESWHHFQEKNCSNPERTLMGELCPSSARGKYYLHTGYRSPFAIQPKDHTNVKKSLLLDLFYDSEDL